MVKEFTAEAIGTFIVVLFGVGAVHAAVLTGAQSGIWQVAIVWGIAIMLAIYTVGSISGAHLNPAITIALATYGRHRWSKVVPYILAQLVGAFIGAAVLFSFFSGFINAKESDKQVLRGEPGSIVTAMCYGEYFPNVGGIASQAGPLDHVALEKLQRTVTPSQACCAECLGTLILAMVIFAVTDPRNAGRPQSNLAPVFIGLTVSALISIIAPLTQAGFNPARDFAPRMFAYLAGWGSVAWPGTNDWSWLTVYILSPIVGAILGGGVYHGLLRPNASPSESRP